MLLDHIDQLHTTDMGISRIENNLKLDTDDVVLYCKNKVFDQKCNIYKQGKNWYCEVDGVKITVNSYRIRSLRHIHQSKFPFSWLMRLAKRTKRKQ